jgi:hypothetical protein
MPARGGAALSFVLLLCSTLAIRSDTAETREPFPRNAEFHFLRLEYVDLFRARSRFGRGWWMQDWPEADTHFAQGIRRLTRIDTGEGRHLPLSDSRVFDHPWMYATQVGYWDLGDNETRQLRDYLLRGGFLVVDDFYGSEDWQVFRETMLRVFPGQPILEIEPGHPMMHV